MANHLTEFTFRIRFRLGATERLGIDTPTSTFDFPESVQRVWLTSSSRNKPISDSEELLVVGGGWPTADAARRAGERFQFALIQALTRVGIGANFGQGGPQSLIFPAGLELFSLQAGARILNDTHGLMVFESEPMPMFASFSGSPRVIKSPDPFKQALDTALTDQTDFTTQQKLAFELYHGSFFETSNRAKFLTLVMAVEVLLEPNPRSAAAQNHVQSLLQQTHSEVGLSFEERQSLLGSLQWLLDESISQAGRRLAKERLGGKEYNGLKAPKFFTLCYDTRSRLVHGAVPPPGNEEVSGIIGPLRLFVSDLLLGTAK